MVLQLLMETLRTSELYGSALPPTLYHSRTLLRVEMMMMMMMNDDVRNSKCKNILFLFPVTRKINYWNSFHLFRPASCSGGQIS